MGVKALGRRGTEHLAGFLTNGHTASFRGSDRSGGAQERDWVFKEESAGGWKGHGVARYPARIPQVRRRSRTAVTLLLLYLHTHNSDDPTPKSALHWVSASWTDEKCGNLRDGIKWSTLRWNTSNYAEHHINITSDAEDLEATDWLQFIYTFDPGVSIMQVRTRFYYIVRCHYLKEKVIAGYSCLI